MVATTLGNTPLRGVVSSWKRNRTDERIAVGVIAAIFALGIARAASSGPVMAPASRVLPTLHGQSTHFALHDSGAVVTIESDDGNLVAEIDLALLVDGQSVPFELASSAPNAGHTALSGAITVPNAGRPVQFAADLVADVQRDALTVRLRAPEDEPLAGIAIRARLPGETQGAFVGGFGLAPWQAEISGSSALVEIEPRPLAAASIDGPVTVQRIGGPNRDPNDSVGISITSPATSAARPQTELHFVVGKSTALVWRPLLEMAGVPSAPIRGHVTGAQHAGARIVGRDASGLPQLTALADDDGSFAFQAPLSVLDWEATLGRESAKQIVRHVPGEGGPLTLELEPRGGVRVLVRDADTRQPLTVRLLIERMDRGSEPESAADRTWIRDPTIVDALRGDATATLPTGRYRIVATKGIEWTIEARDLNVVSGQAALVELDLRHVVPTPGIVGCDLHTHTGPSFDSKTSPEESVLSLVAAGIDFAVPTGHNVVTDDGRAIAALGLEKEFASVPGVEVTTYNPRFGHFGVFPIPADGPVPPYRHSSVESITRVARADRKRYFQLNHPRLPGGIGLFDTINLDPRAVRSRLPTRLDFDGIEVYNGFDIEHPSRVDQVLRDYWGLLDQGWHYTATGGSDSHCLQYHCVVKVLDHTLESGAGAGYPRTMVTVDPNATLDHHRDSDDLDPEVIIENLKAGHATVTSGPLIDLRLEGTRPGDQLVTTSGLVRGHVVVRAAPWIDVTQVQIVAGQTGGEWRVVDSFDVPSQPTRWGPGDGTLEEEQARTIRFDRDIAVPLGRADGWVQVLARGTRHLSDVLPFVEVTPMALTNPVYVVRHLEPPGSLTRAPIR